jgi:hypothetical protein
LSFLYISDTHRCTRGNSDCSGTSSTCKRKNANIRRGFTRQCPRGDGAQMLEQYCSDIQESNLTKSVGRTFPPNKATPIPNKKASVIATSTSATYCP